MRNDFEFSNKFEHVKIYLAFIFIKRYVDINPVLLPRRPNGLKAKSELLEKHELTQAVKTLNDILKY